MDREMAQIETHASIEEYFGDLLKEALATERLCLGDASAAYVLRLFSEFAERGALHARDTRGERGTPALVWLYERAQTGGSGVRFDSYRHLGDVALFVSGFFGPHITRARSAVGVEYYVDMGQAAYDTAAVLAKPTGFGALLSELAAKFRRLVEVLTRVAERTTLPVARDMTALYERLMMNPESTDLFKRLLTKGVVPVFGSVGALA